MEESIQQWHDFSSLMKYFKLNLLGDTYIPTESSVDEPIWNETLPNALRLCSFR